MGSSEDMCPAPVWWEDDGPAIIDQTLLPREERTLRPRRLEEMEEAIKALRVRGAPVIGIFAAMSLASLALRHAASYPDELAERVARDAVRLAATRPTAVNLFYALKRMTDRLESSVSAGDTPQETAAALVDEALSVQREEIEATRLISLFGAPLIGEGQGILNHCNAGALATGGLGTSLGVLRLAWRQGTRFTAYVDETRPLLQGARLTAWELRREGIPAFLICDDMAGHLMKTGRIQAVIVGADRIAANGDAANKIGTYSLAVLARHHGLPFYVAAAASTFDMELEDGEAIPIEERDPSEVREFGGRPTAPEGMPVCNPAFDVTPAGLITAIITDRGLIEHPDRRRVAAVLGRG